MAARAPTLENVVDTHFVAPATALLQNDYGSSKDAYRALGVVWHETYQQIEALGPDLDGHDDLASLVETELAPKLTELMKANPLKTTSGTRVYCKISSIVQEASAARLAYVAHQQLQQGGPTTGAATQDAKDAGLLSRAASAFGFGGRAAEPAATGPVTAPVAPAAPVTRQPLVLAPELATQAAAGLGEPDLVDALIGRMENATASAPAGAPGHAQGQGSLAAPGFGPRGTSAAAALSPALNQAAQRLQMVGAPPLRVNSMGQSLLTNVLRCSDSGTLTGWVEKQRKLSGHALREALTIGRAMDLAVLEMGPGYLATSAAEVQVRRLLSLAIHGKTGSWRLAPVLEEVPTDSMIPELPEAMIAQMGMQLKAYAKIGLEQE